MYFVTTIIKRKETRFMRNALSLFTSVSLLVIAIFYFGPQNIISEAQNINFIYFAFAVILAFLQIPLATRRWQLILNLLTPLPAFILCLRAQALSMYAGLFVPGIISGTAIKTVMVRRAGVRIKHALISIIFDKVAIVLPLLCVIAFSMPFMADEYFLDNKLDNIPKVILSIFLLLIGAFIFSAMLFRYLRNDFQIFKDLILNHKKKFVFIFLWGLALIAIGITQYWVLFEFKVELTKLILVAPMVIFISSLPLSVGGWGVREGSGILFFTLIGIPGELALLATIQVGFSGVITSLAGVFLWSKDFIPEAKEVMKVAINRHAEKDQ